MELGALNNTEQNAYLIRLLFPILFADDTNIFLSGNNIDGIIDIMNGEIIDWLDSNMLSLYIDKTHALYNIQFKIKEIKIQ